MKINYSMESMDTHIHFAVNKWKKIKIEGKQIKKDKNKNTNACYFFLNWLNCDLCADIYVWGPKKRVRFTRFAI